MEKEQFEKIIKNKSIVFDTNIFIKAVENIKKLNNDKWATLKNDFDKIQQSL